MKCSWNNANALFYMKSYCNALRIGEEDEDNWSWPNVDLTCGEIHGIWCMVYGIYKIDTRERRKGKELGLTRGLNQGESEGA